MDHMTDILNLQCHRRKMEKRDLKDFWKAYTRLAQTYIVENSHGQFFIPVYEVLEENGSDKASREE